MFNKMAIYRCILCNKEYNTKQSSPLSLPCGDIFCEQCLLLHYNKKNEIIKCQKHKKEFIIDYRVIIFKFIYSFFFGAFQNKL